MATITDHDRMNMIQKAINTASNILDFDEFIELNEYSLPDISDFKELYNDRVDTLLLVKPRLIKAFGYDGTIVKQKFILLTHALKYGIPFVQLNNAEYEIFRNKMLHQNRANIESTSRDINNIYELYPRHKNIHGRLHLLMTPLNLQLLAMTLYTQKTAIMQEYYYQRSTIYSVYTEYMTEYMVRRVG